MDAISVLINNKPLSIQDSKDIINKLKNDDAFLIDYICRAVNCQRIPFCSVEDLPTMTITRISDTTVANIPGPSSENPSQALENVAIANMSISRVLSSSEETSPPTVSAPPKKIDVWISKGKPSQQDKQATYEMLQLRASEKYVKKFNNKSSVKLDLWKEIAISLQEMGYNVDARSCRQKFANLYNKYIKFKEHVKSTGVERREPPEFYDLLDQILGKKDKVNLNYVCDTLDIVEMSQENTHLNSGISDIENAYIESEDSINLQSRNTVHESHHSDTDTDLLEMSELIEADCEFPNQQLGSADFTSPGKRKLSKIPVQDKKKQTKFMSKKHTLTKSDILNAITSSQKEQRQQQDNQFNKIMNVLSEQNQLMKQQNSQRDDFLKIMRDFLKPKKKRKHSDSDSDD